MEPTEQFRLDRFAADLPKILDGREKLYYRFAVDKALDQQILQYLSGQRVPAQDRLSAAYDYRPDDHYRRDASP